MGTNDRKLTEHLRRATGESMFSKLEVHIRKKQLDMDLVRRLRNPLGTTDSRYVIQRAFMCVSFSECHHGDAFLEMVHPDQASYFLKAAKESRETEDGYSVKIPRWQIMILAKSLQPIPTDSEAIEIFVNEVLLICAKSLEVVIDDE